MTAAFQVLLHQIASPRLQPVASHSLTVVAIARLLSTGRAWFITEVKEKQDGMRASGYEPGCQHAPGPRWFELPVEFFEEAARLTSDKLDVEILPEPVPLENMVDVAF